MPLVTVGMPILNGQASVARAIGDILGQTFTDFQLVVCDNASKDKTLDIVYEIAKSDERIKIIPFSERVDIRLSFKRAFDAAHTPYFMFAPGDDCWYPQFIENNLAVLETHPNLIASTGRVAFFNDGKFSHISKGTSALLSSVEENLVEYLTEPYENARAFSLFRTEVLKGAFPENTYPGWDFQMIARTLRHGQYFELDEVLAERDITSFDDYIKQAENYFDNRFLNLVPLHKFGYETIIDAEILKARRKKRALAKLMVKSHLNYARVRLPRWHNIISAFGQLFELDDLPQYDSSLHK